MRNVLNKIFVRKLGVGKFVFSGLAFFIGFTLVLLALQGYVRIRDYLKPDKSKFNFVIINKEVVMANTIFGSHAQFSDAETGELKQQPFIEDLAVFNSNTYEVIAHAGGEMGLYTELFFESVPSRFIDVPTSGFTWETGSDFVPIIISQDFIDLYNFGFALGKGTRQLSRSTIRLVPIDIDIAGAGGRKKFTARIVGFSDRIPSVLVPDEFLKWTNEHIGGSAKDGSSRVILKVKANGSRALESYLNEHGLVVSNEKMKFGKLLSAVDIFMVAVILIGVGFMVFALVIIILNFSLIVSQAGEEVSLLRQLGYSRKQLVAHLTRYLLIFMVVVIGASAVAWWLGNTWLVSLLKSSGIEVSKSLTFETAIVAAGFTVLFFGLSYATIDRLIRRQHP